MLAEIFLLHLENLLRENADRPSRSPSSDPRFVPITMPRKDPPASAAPWTHAASQR